jgi:hypothetical protein
MNTRGQLGGEDDELATVAQLQALIPHGTPTRQITGTEGFAGHAPGNQTDVDQLND